MSTEATHHICNLSPLSRIYHTTAGREVVVRPGEVVRLHSGESLDYRRYARFSPAIVYVPASGRLVGKDVCGVLVHQSENVT